MSRTAEEQLELDLLAWADRMSSGDLDNKELRRRGFPYAVRLKRNAAGRFVGNGKMFMGESRFINDQTGTFRRSWTVVKASDPDSGMTEMALVNLAPYANKLFDGIPGLTVPRPVLSSPKSKRELAKIEARYEKAKLEQTGKRIAKSISDAFR